MKAPQIKNFCGGKVKISLNGMIFRREMEVVEIIKKASPLCQITTGVLFEIIHFLSPKDSTTLGSTCKLLYNLVCDEHLWYTYSTRLLAFIQSPLRIKEYVKEATLALEFPKSKDLYICLHKAKASLIGWYMLVPSRKNYDEHSGGLVCIRLNTLFGYPQQVITLEVIEASGKCISCMKIKYSTEHKKLICYINENYNDGMYTFEFDSRGDIELKSININNIYFLQMLPQNIQQIKRKDLEYFSYRTTVLENIKRITGLFVAPFGSHGLELLHISLIENEGRISEETSMVEDDDEPYYIIDGLKVTGDPNVPATQLSFTVDVTHTFDYRNWIQDDQRPIIFFSYNGVADATLMSERENNIRTAYRGKGQINAIANVWEPRWVDLTLVIYVDPSLSNGATFSIVWDDHPERYRHLMDFLPFSGRQYPPCVEPQLNWSSTNFLDLIVRNGYDSQI